MADKASKTEAERQINLSALRKHDPDIDQIIDTASSVAHYKFNATSGVWEKTDVEGALFLYSRRFSPYVIIFIMNRLNTQNTKMVLTSNMEFKIQEPFLLCKASNSEIIGIWFYEQTECQRFGSLLTKLAVVAKDETSLKIAVMMEGQKKTAEKMQSQHDILGMFSKAQNDYQNNRSKQHHKEKQPKINKGLPQQQQNKKPTLHQHLSEPGEIKIASPPVNRLSPNIHKQQVKKMSPKTTRKIEIQKKQAEFKEKHLKDQETLLSILHGGEQRKGIRTRTMSSADDVHDDRFNHNFSSKAGDLAIFDKLGITETSYDSHKTPRKAIGCEELESTFLGQNQPIHTVQSLPVLSKINPDFSSIKAPMSNEACSVSEAKPSSLALHISSTSGSGLNLLSPSAITAKSGKGRGATLGVIMNCQQKTLAANLGKGTTTAKKLFPDDEKPEIKTESLLSPAAFQAKVTMMKPEHDADLTSDQFREALLHMITNDQSFVNQLHAAYLEVRKNR